VVQPTELEDQGILSTHLHSDGRSAELLAMYNPGTHANHWTREKLADFNEAEVADMFMSKEMVEKSQNFPNMDGPAVFKMAAIKFPEVIREALDKNGFQVSDIDLLVPHQANLRISQFLESQLGLKGRVYNNIQRYGNTTAASIPIGLCEAWEEGRVKRGDLICLASFGSGFTWGSILLKW
jgi:3-oxoacyl-[acyl-carrier-protein] synthase-3